MLTASWTRTVVLLQEYRSAEAVAEALENMDSLCSRVQVGEAEARSVYLPRCQMQSHVASANARHFAADAWERARAAVDAPSIPAAEQRNGADAHAVQLPVGPALWFRWQRFVSRAVQRHAAAAEARQALTYQAGSQPGRVAAPPPADRQAPSLRELMRRYREDLRRRQQQPEQERKRGGLYARQGLSSTSRNH